MIEQTEYANIYIYTVMTINGTNIIEDEFHFILICPLYKHERSFYIQKYFTYSHQAVLISLLSSNCHSKINDLAASIYHV